MYPFSRRSWENKVFINWYFQRWCVITRITIQIIHEKHRQWLYLFDEEDNITKEDRKRNNLFHSLKDSIVGGPNIIFNRYYETNKTFIRELNQKCKKIIGYDANDLYLWAIAREMPIGKHGHIKRYDLEQ